MHRPAKRGVLDSEKGVDANLYVWVYDHHIAEGDGFRPADDRDELVEEPHDRIRYLEEESSRKTIYSPPWSVSRL